MAINQKSAFHLDGALLISPKTYTATTAGLNLYRYIMYRAGMIMIIL